MFDNLKAEMARNRLCGKDIAIDAGITEKSLFNKMSGKTNFTLKEMNSIKKKRFPMCSLDYLFGDSPN